MVPRVFAMSRSRAMRRTRPIGHDLPRRGLAPSRVIDVGIGDAERDDPPHGSSTHLDRQAFLRGIGSWRALGEAFARASRPSRVRVRTTGWPAFGMTTIACDGHARRFTATQHRPRCSGAGAWPEARTASPDYHRHL